MRRVMLFFRRLGFFQSALFVLFLAYMSWAYSRLWATPGGPFFVLSVLGIGIGVSTALMPLMYRNYLLAHKIVSALGVVLMIAVIAIFRTPILLPPWGYWLLHVIVWLQVTANFWIGTYEPQLGEELLRLLKQMEVELVTDVPEDDAAPTSRKSHANHDEDDENWYRRN